MTQAAEALSHGSFEWRTGRADAGASAQRELLIWGWLAFGALAVAGIFAVLLALSRLPGGWGSFLLPLDFFYKGLVIHVVFSLVIWLLAILAFVAAYATYEVGEGSPRAEILGRIGQGLTLLAFPCLFGPAFLESANAELTNYVPLIRHPIYDLGLILLALGVLAPVVRLFINLPGRASRLSTLSFAAVAIGWIYIVALVTFLLAGLVLARTGDVSNAREQLNWGGGHMLQFAYAALLLTNWSILARRSFGEKAFDPDFLRLALSLIVVFTLPSLGFYLAFDPFSAKLHDAYRLLQFSMALPAALFVGSALIGAFSTGPIAKWPWRDPALTALATSVALFAVGGFMGLLISGSDTRTPAHYHAAVTAVSVSALGVMLTFGLEVMGRMRISERATRLFVLLYGGGQLVASLGMFVAGGYGAQRKTPSGVGRLVDAAAAGMFVHGVAALLAVIGGAALVVMALRALARRAA